eukprot:gnl/MRDRNA2_/MRDRNA2_72359_c0_seq2.p1 gnl/MRDRNA2_/MRDRNA2_72359_c0~~gnl/MRDRNA2_/MRDRNA2_72359_c0_seq2.p1  ORF type:complete len:398 (+),score=64.86 gnl/MRDRNA2_/MRDRNA2_72359_c0_seq2:168-1361(+)
MKLFLFAVLPFTSRANWHQVCYSGKITIGNETWTQHDLMNALHPQVNEAIVEIANHDEALMQFLTTQGECQIDCLEVVMQPTFTTLYGKLGQDFYSHHKKHIQEIFIEALSGAFTACYPHPPRDEVRKVAESIIAHIGYAPPAHHTFPPGVPCPYEGYEHDFPLNDFLQSFEVTIMQVMQQKPGMAAFFDEQAKDCQKTCLSGVVPVSAMTLFLTNTDDPAAGIDALTGAIHACFPDVPHEDINMLVSETKDVMDDAEAAAAYTKQMMEQAAARRRQLDKIPLSRGASRRRAEKKDRRRATLVHTQESLPKQQQQQLQQEKEVQRQQEETGSIGAFSLFSTVMAVSLLCLTAGLFLGRRFNVSSVRSVGTVGSYQLLPTSLGSSGSALTSTYTPPQF